MPLKDRWINKTCLVCGKQFSVRLSRQKQRSCKYCSRKCYYKAFKLGLEEMPGGAGDKNPMYGKHHSDKAKAKIGEVSRRTWTGRKHKPETIEKIREAEKKVKYLPERIAKATENLRVYRLIHGPLKGEKHPNWQGGISFEEYGADFTDELKDKIRQRDLYRCRYCGSAGYEDKKLSVHHIDYNKKNNSEDNLITLCDNCHTKTNFNRKEWMIILKNLLKTKPRYNGPVYFKNRVEIKCDFCGKLVQVPPSRIKNRKFIFCSVSCFRNFSKQFRNKENGKFVEWNDQSGYIIKERVGGGV